MLARTLLLAMTVTLAVSTATPATLDRSLMFRFEYPKVQSATFADNYLPRVRRHLNASLDRMWAGHGIDRCRRDRMTTSSWPPHPCLILSEGQYEMNPDSSGIVLTAFEISLQLHLRTEQHPDAQERTVFDEEAAQVRARIEAIEGIRDFARLNVTEWVREDDGDSDGGTGSCLRGVCRSPSSLSSSATAALAAVVVAASIALGVVGAVLMVRRRRLRREEAGDSSTSSASAYTEDVEGERQKLKLRHNKRPRTSISASAAISLSIVGSSTMSADRLGWLNLAFRHDDPCHPLPSRVQRFRGVDPADLVDSGEAARQFASLNGDSSSSLNVGGIGGGSDSGAFYLVGRTFVLACPSATMPNERLFDLLWSCSGLAFFLDPGFDLAERLTTPDTLTGRFHLAGWDRQNFPCYSVFTATLHCLDTNLTKRLRLSQFTGRWDPENDVPASRAEFVRFASACANHVKVAMAASSSAVDAAPAAAVFGPQLSSASLLPAVLMAVDELRHGGGSCDLLRLAAKMRRECPGAVASLQHYMFIMHCLHAYAFLIKRNSI